MLDIKFIKENLEIVKQSMVNRRKEPIDFDKLLSLADERLALRKRVDEINRKRNETAAARDIEAGKRLKDELQGEEEKLAVVEKDYLKLLLQIPNIPSPDTPIGPDESGNKVLRQVGEKPVFNFKAKPHWEIGSDLGIINSEKAAVVSGARFTYLMGDIVLLQYALQNLAIKILTDEEILKDIASRAGLNVSTKPFIPVVPPFMMRSAVMNRMARLDPIDERYYYEKDDLVFIGSAEHTLGPLHMDETHTEDRFPIRYVGYSPAFRREAGSYSKDTRGIIRMHHFDKVELESFVRPEDGYLEQDFIVAIQEHFLQLLQLPYQAVAICTGDMGSPDHRQIDMETWMPGQDAYRETNTSDYMGGYQARRLNTKIKRADGSTEPVHMNDATMVAMGRTLAAILENFQQADGTVRVPKALQPYMGKETIGKS